MLLGFQQRFLTSDLDERQICSHLAILSLCISQLFSQYVACTCSLGLEMALLMGIPIHEVNLKQNSESDP